MLQTSKEKLTKKAANIGTMLATHAGSKRDMQVVSIVTRNTGFWRVDLAKRPLLSLCPVHSESCCVMLLSLKSGCVLRTPLVGAF